MRWQQGKCIFHGFILIVVVVIVVSAMVLGVTLRLLVRPIPIRRDPMILRHRLCVVPN